MSSKQKFNGLSFDVDMGNFSVHIKKFSLEITDNSAVAKRNGKPDGYVRGDVEASGVLVVYRDGLKTITAAAKEAGSFQKLPPFDINSYAKVGDDELKIEAFDCKLKISSLLDIDETSPDETEFSLPYDVIGKDFVKIDGVPYADVDDEEKK